jgi:hypothetical protein
MTIIEEPGKNKKLSKSLRKLTQGKFALREEDEQEKDKSKTEAKKTQIAQVTVSSEYENILALSANRLDEIYQQVKVAQWATYKAIFEIVASAGAVLDRVKGRPKKGREHLTMTKIYKDLAKKSKFWSVSHIKRAHLVYEQTLKFLDNDHDRVITIQSEPSCVESVVLATIDDKDKSSLIKKMANQRITRQNIRAAVQNIQSPTTSGVEIFHNNLWVTKSYDPRYGIEGIPGRTPGQLIYNFFYHFVKDSSHCALPFFGSGTEGDVAKEFSCTYFGWDIDLFPAVAKKHKNYAVVHDSRLPWPVDPESNDVVFMDPPRIFDDDGFIDNQDAVGEDRVINYFDCLGQTIAHAVSALVVGGVLGLLLRQPYATEIPLEDFTFQVHTKHLEPSLEFVRRIAVSFPRGIREPNRAGMLSDGYLDFLIYSKR